MTKIARISKFLQKVFLLFFILTPILSILSWAFYPGFNIGLLEMRTMFEPNEHWHVANLTYLTHFYLCLVNIIPALFNMFCFYCLIKLFKLFEEGHIFTLKNVQYIRYVGLSLLFYEAVSPFIQAVTSFLLTFDKLHHPKATVSISIANYDISNIIMGVIVLLISWIMTEACKLQEEHAYTV